MSEQEPTVGQLIWAYIFGTLTVILIGYLGYALNPNALQNIVSGPYEAIFLGLIAGISTGDLLVRILTPKSGLGLAAGLGGYTVIAFVWSFYGGLIPDFLWIPASPSTGNQFSSSSLVFVVSAFMILSGHLSGLIEYNQDVAAAVFLLADLVFPFVLFTIWLVLAIVLPLVEARKFLLVVLVIALTAFVTYLFWSVLEGTDEGSSYASRS